MANKRITDLTAITTLESADLFAVVDSDAGETKKATLTQLIAAMVGGTQVWGESVSGTGTGWTLAHTPVTGTVRLYANGQRLTTTVDYTLLGATITTVNSWNTGTVLADYIYT